jgi:plasmid stabilization system protein ParE
VTLIVRREAEAEIVEAFNWYESKRVGLGREFVEEIDAAFVRTTETPDAFPVVYRGLRRLVLRRFPYVIYFRLEEDVVQVVGVLHGRRNRTALRRRTPSP